jgi:membrane protein YdbS with pleckstrin-like domain
MTDSPSAERVSLRADNDLPWVRVSPALATVRTIVLLGVLGAVAVVGVMLALVVTAWLWILVLVAAVVALWGVWLIRRQVSAISFAELEEDLVIRKGRMFRRLVAIPYGRLQYVDLQSGPLSRQFGLAGLELHTASPESGGDIPGLPIADAEALRERLAARGESQRAGL